ncbi:MAG: gamma carbonic anhydrase family protein [Planctomycetota bacterium]|jgi:carbonic anhydrase/acetyltransferase-like protein (isoleucine patch superfamily)
MEHDRLNLTPQTAEAIWIAPGAVVVGDVTLGPRASVWFGAVLRGDTESLVVGADTNLQDQVVLHADPGFPCRLGDRVTVGHGAIVHGATVESDSLIGMRATLLNGAVIGAGSVVAAGALVTEGKVFPERSLIVGVPARRLRGIEPQDAERIARGWKHYVALALAFAARYGRLGERADAIVSAESIPSRQAAE